MIKRILQRMRPGRVVMVLILMTAATSCTTHSERPRTRVKAPAHGRVEAGLNASRDHFADAHVHLIDFLQNGAFDNSDGRFQGVGERGQITKGSATRYNPLPYGEQWRRLTLVLKDMEAGGVDQAMISGMPFLKKWSANEPFARPGYYLDSDSQMIRARDTDYLVGMAVMDYRREFSRNEERLQILERLYPFICGFDGTDLGAADFVVKRIKEFPGTWKGIGEVMSRHDDLSNLTTGERPRANHPAIKRLSRFAGEWFLPVSIHHNIAPISRSASEVKEPLYLDELVELFDYCRLPNAEPETKFIWCHAGISRRVVVDNLPHWIDVVLNRFQGQVFVDLSWVVYEDYIAKDLEAWAMLIRKYPNSFMLGSDVVGSGANIGSELARYQPLLDAISKNPNHEVRRNLARDNFVNLMADLGRRRLSKMASEGLIADASTASTGLVLKSDYEFDERAHTGASNRSFIREHRP